MHLIHKQDLNIISFYVQFKFFCGAGFPKLHFINPENLHQRVSETLISYRNHKIQQTDLITLCIASVTWSKVMSPLGTAMNFIYNKARKSAHCVHLLQLCHEAFTFGQLFRGHIQKFHDRCFICHGVLDCRHSISICGGIQHHSINFVVFQRDNLILHE